MRRLDAYRNDELVSTVVAARIVGVGPTTMRKYADRGLIAVQRTPGGQRRFLVRDARRLNVRTGPTSSSRPTAAGAA